MEKKTDFRLLLDIFITFFKIGGFTFGGGYAMIPIIEREIITKKGWIKNEKEIIDVFAVAESIPGAIAINTSTFVGYKIAGRKGAIVAACGVILPSFIIISLIAAFFSQFQDNPMVKAAFMGVRSTVVALIIIAAIKVGKKAIEDKTSVIISLVTIILVLVLDIHAIFAILGGAILGIIIYITLPEEMEKINGQKDEIN